MLSHLDGKAVIVCDGCHTDIEEVQPLTNMGYINRALGYQAIDGDGNPVVGHVCKDTAEECAEKFKANALKVRKAVPEVVPA